MKSFVLLVIGLVFTSAPSLADVVDFKSSCWKNIESESRWCGANSSAIPVGGKWARDGEISFTVKTFSGDKNQIESLMRYMDQAISAALRGPTMDQNIVNEMFEVARRAVAPMDPSMHLGPQAQINKSEISQYTRQRSNSTKSECVDNLTRQKINCRELVLRQWIILSEYYPEVSQQYMRDLYNTALYDFISKNRRMAALGLDYLANTAWSDHPYARGLALHAWRMSTEETSTVFMANEQGIRFGSNTTERNRALGNFFLEQDETIIRDHAGFLFFYDSIGYDSDTNAYTQY